MPTVFCKCGVMMASVNCEMCHKCIKKGGYNMEKQPCTIKENVKGDNLYIILVWDKGDSIVESHIEQSLDSNAGFTSKKEATEYIYDFLDTNNYNVMIVGAC